MTLSEYCYRKVPEYYDTMYLDGFTPDEIHYAMRRKMKRDIEEREQQINLEKQIEKEIEKALEKALDELLKDFQ